MEFPSLLGMEPPRLLGYPIEAVIAEKYEAMISLGMMNSRFKDFYDIVFLSGIYEIEGAKLQQSLFNVLRQRGTNLNRTIYTQTSHITNTVHMRPAKGFRGNKKA